MMQPFKQVISQLIDISENELQGFLQNSRVCTFKKNEWISFPGAIPNEIYFLITGIIRVVVTDAKGQEHTIHFALENQFIVDYSAFIQQAPALYGMQAIEETTALALPRSAIQWGYSQLKEGQKLGRLIAEYYFIYQENRIKNLYLLSPKERYDRITEVFPNIHNRAPQHMIASYLGITPIHLSRLKKKAL